MKKLQLYQTLPQAKIMQEQALHIDHACQRCKLHETVHTRCMSPEGEPGGVLFVAEMPGRVEDQTGRPFSGGSGKYLRAQIKRWWKGKVAFDNAVRCAPGMRTVTDKMIDVCRPYGAKVVRDVDPQRIVCMGNASIYAVLGRRVPVMSVRRGYAWLFGDDGTPVPVFFTVNPAVAMRNRFVGRAFESDLEWALTCTIPTTKFTGETWLVRTHADAIKAWAHLHPCADVTYDVETSGKMGNSDFVIESCTVLGAGDTRAWTWTREAMRDHGACDVLKRVLEKMPVITQNGKYDDRAVLTYIGADVRNVKADTRLFRKLLDFETSASLEVLAELVGLGGHKSEAQDKLDTICKELRYQANPPSGLTPTGKQRKVRAPTFDIEEAVLDQIKGGAEAMSCAFRYLDDETLYRYNARDVFSTREVHAKLESQINKHSETIKRVWREIVCDASKAIRWIEHWGIAVDKGAIQHFAQYCKAKEVLHTRKLSTYGTFNPASSIQLAEFLFDKLKLRSIKSTPGGKPSTDAESLEDLRGQHPAVEHILELRKYSKLNGTYATGMQVHIREDERIHASYLLDGAGCLPAGELVLTDRGYIPTETVRRGDQVITHRGHRQPVLASRVVGSSKIVGVRLRNGTYLRASDNHEFWTPRGWVRADHLKLGDQVYTHAKQEVWRSVVGWELDYEISSWGRVRSKRSNHVLAQQPKGKWGHLKVSLVRNGAQKRGENRRDFPVHRLVALAFLGYPGKGQEVRHLNGIAWDNTVGNLVYGTAKENRADAVRHGSHDASIKLTAKDVKLIRSTRRPLHGGAGRWDKSGAISDAVFAKKYGVTREYIRDIRNNKRWSRDDRSPPKAKFHLSSVRHLIDCGEEVVYGLTVEHDHSHVTGGMVTHNTGRLSSAEPNMQNIPRAKGNPEGKMLRDCFIAPTGFVLVEADQSQIELRVAAMLSQDKNMMQDYIDGIDIHANNARECCEIVWGIKREQWDKMSKDDRDPYRTQIKTTTFGKLYGKTDAGLAAEFNCSKEQVKAINAKIWGRYSTLASWIKQCVAFSQRTGDTWTWWNGKDARRRRVWGVADSDETMRSHAERTAYNTRIQGTAADFTTASLWPIVSWILDEGVPAKVIATIHDSILVEVHKTCLDETCAKMNQVMTSWPSLGVPLMAEFKVGDRWGSMESHEVK